jgi:hypothetical protein
MTCICRQILFGHGNKQSVIGLACSISGEKAMPIGFFLGYLKESKHLYDLSVDNKIIVTWI